MIKVDSNGLIVDPRIEEITKEDILDYYNQLKKDKPKQYPIGEFQKTECDSAGCSFKGILHRRQTFCPICNYRVNVLGNANDQYDILIREWMGSMRIMEVIINGDLSKYINDMNERISGKKLTPVKHSTPREHDELLADVIDPSIDYGEIDMDDGKWGEEPYIDEPITD